MFESSFLEMLVVGIVALLVIGPERLPEIAAKAGRMVAKARAFVANTRQDIERELQTEEMRRLLNKQEEEIRELRDIMQQGTDKLGREARSAENLMRNTMKPGAHGSHDAAKISGKKP
ncbi:MAG: twin-arginine translocase subunit TatB [Thiothrix sp.]|nr:twin-arginine translocase subunit TatB [Thiothrix sp.]HPE60517.1 Sec-independent protein translocase protein TatB [Thiolinea sp.]